MNRLCFLLCTAAGVVWASTALLDPAPAHACTTACTPPIDNVGVMVVKSYDWDNRDGLVFLNRKGLHKKAVATRSKKPMEWDSSHFNVTFTQYGLNWPMSGMNDTGLVVEILKVGNTSDYPSVKKHESGTKAINPLQWIQYMLDTCDDLECVKGNAAKVYIDNTVRFAVSAFQVPVSFTIDTVHYNVCDKAGQCMSVEYRDKYLLMSNIHAWKGTPTKDFPQGTLPFGEDPVGPKAAAVERPLVPVLANRFFDQDSACLAAYQSRPQGVECSKDAACAKACPSSSSKSASRFIRAAASAQAVKGISTVDDAVKYGFNTVAKAVCDKGATQWQIVYLPGKNKVYWRTMKDCEPKHKGHGYVDLNKHLHSCKDKNKKIKVYDLDGSVAAKPYKVIEHDEVLKWDLQRVIEEALYEHFLHSRLQKTIADDCPSILPWASCASEVAKALSALQMKSQKCK